MVDDVFNNAEVNTILCVSGEHKSGHRSPRAWHGSREAAGTCEALSIPTKKYVWVMNNSIQKLLMTIGRESDQFIVLRDGRAVHMGKGLAVWWNHRVKLSSDA